MITDDEKDVKIWGGRQAAGDLIVQIGTQRTDSDGAASQRLLSLVTDINGTPSEKAYVDGAGILSVAGLSNSGSSSISSNAGVPASGTGVTVNATGALRHVIHKITLDFNSWIDASSAAKDVTAWTLPAKTRILRIVADVTTKFLGGAIATCTMRAGKAANGAEYLVDKDVFTAAVTAGDAAAEIGASLLSATVADLTWAGTQIVNIRLTSTGANLVLTQGSVTVYIECAVYP